ncbi:NB-ARC domain protein [Frankia canadensis]|uniref:NB-ARC domain protein n=1 Tax=Frankia canadensis TaxID=1836972 RepID=A0A2I2KZ38_9ACTN|nr:FxSxx-COOH system tetratricopeptide repeat protein [Frankia canadensis]SNQ50910.1 NB-ARC domain protein [Frankia canadensis]SOU58200.1 NB-ARC domain protein [Frankia canadensis]
MNGIDTAVGAVFTWMVRQERHVGEQAHADTDRIVAPALGRVHDLVREALGEDDPVLARVRQEARDGREQPTDRTRRRLRLALEEAADQDPVLAAALARAAVDVGRARRQAGGRGLIGSLFHGPTAVQMGDRNNQHVHVHLPAARPAVEWPVRVGNVPPVAGLFHPRAAVDQLARAAVGAGTCQVLTGMGGVGKTQLAAHHADQVWKSGRVDALVWVTAAHREQILTGYAEAAEALFGADPADPRAAARKLLDWLVRTEERWMIVLDDVADPADLTGLWPPDTAAGQVLITTRRRDAALTGSGRVRVDLGLFTPAEAQAYVTAALAAHGRTDDPGQIQGLAADLNHLPLALAQAAAYLADSAHLDCAAYRARLADQARTLDQLAPHSLPDSQLAPVAAAWALSIDRANTLRPRGLAGPLLELAAVLDPNGIPTQVLTSPPARTYLAAHRRPPGDDGGDAAGDHLPVDAQDAADAVACLCLLSLAEHTPTPGGGLLRVHQLIQRAVRDRLAPDRLAEVARVAGDGLLAVWPRVESDPGHAQILRANTNAVHTTAAQGLWNPGVHPVLFHAGTSLGQSGLATTAAGYFDRLCATARRTLGPDHPDTLASRHNLASWRGQAGDAAAAAVAFDRLLADCLRVLGPDHPHTLTARHNLAFMRGRAGDAAGAAAAFQALLADRLRLLGPEHPDTLAARGNLARSRGESGDVAGAVAASATLLADRLRLLGPDHPATLITRHELAHWRGQAGDSAGAAAALTTILADQLRILGADHPHTLTTRHELAHWRGRAGDATGAAAAFDRLLADRLRILGPDHPDIVSTRAGQARWRGEAGDAAGAAAATQTLLADQLRTLGPEHPDTLTTRHNRAYWQGEQGDAAGAVAAFEALLADRLRILGPDHPDTLTTRHELARWRGTSGDAAGAVAAFEALLADQLRILGPDHSDTLTTRHHLCRWLGQAGDAAGAAAATETLLADRRRILGPDHPDTLMMRGNLAAFYWQAGRAAEAMTLLERVITDFTRVLGAEHPNTVAIAGVLHRWQADTRS